MRIQNIIFVIFGVVLSLSVISALQYKAKAERSELALKQLQATYSESQKMLEQYQKKMSSLTKALNDATTQAEKRKQALQEVLNNEQNQKWRDGVVPSDVVRVFNERASQRENKVNLPSNNRMPNN
ncbi:hypothetical protein EIM44_04805 [Bibersteinia trehalosi]|uniref:DUF2570 domain-containing protein n=1 Tax=Bibersteinia trehalosi TaxID=47735 RepID=A0A3R8LEA6_BIBTR|nr:hypothetical protein [Bibersteinia trehalosi]RRN04760.1 hypothetical protein EIM44_04805 [Bibersteinia trehalosi]